MTDPHQTWINKGSNPIPEWVRPHVASQRDPNGTFLIKTVPGDAWTISKEVVQARVLVGNIVLLRDDIALTCPADEVRDRLAALDLAAQPAPVAQGIYQPAVRAARAKKHDGDSTNCPDVGTNRKPSPSTKPARKQSYPAARGARPTIEWLHLDRLTMDASYQRSTDNQASQRLITSIAANFDWRLCTPLVVSRRADGTFAVIDGQHRLLAARLRGMDDLPCCVFTYESAEEEAKMFVAANRSRKAMNRLDDFHAALAAGDGDAHQVLQLVTDAGLTVARNTSSTAWAAGEIAFTASIASTLKRHGAAIVSKALTLIAEAFPDQRVVQSGSIFLGLVKVLTSPPDGFDADRLFRALLRYDAEGWGSFVAGLKGGDTRATAIRDALMMAYDETPAELEHAA